MVGTLRVDALLQLRVYLIARLPIILSAGMSVAGQQNPDQGSQSQSKTPRFSLLVLTLAFPTTSFESCSCAM
jgi:hypothetical protein